MNGAQLVTQTLKKAGVTTIFSLSGNQIMPIYDACIDADIRIVHVRHEAAAVFMADAWAQITGEVGIALLTAAPGFLNGLGPVYSARLAESPILMLSGDSPLGSDGNGAFQELDQVGVSTPLFKMAMRPTSAADLGTDVAAAIQAAHSGRPGPVHIALPFDLLNEPEAGTDHPAPEAMKAADQPISDQLANDIVAELQSAKHPLIITGPTLNASRNRHIVSELETSLGIPVICMESPRGLNDPSLGAVAEVLASADVIVLLGKPVDFTMKFGKPPSLSDAARIIVVDPEPEKIARAETLLTDRLKLKAVASAAAAAQAITRAAGNSPHSAQDWVSEVKAAISYRGPAHTTEAHIHPRDICNAAQELLDGADDPILVCDGGEVGQWAQAFCSAQTRVINGMSGAIGGSICYAIAAKIARPHATVVALMGDGTAGFHFAEFDTAVRERANLITVVCNDFAWNAEVQIQKREYGADRLIGCELAPSARYDLAAAGFGCHGEHVTKPQDIAAALQRATASDLPACLNVEMKGQPAPSFKRA